ncbi:transglycosylase SLT domain protein [Brucella abortus bv. 6 str. 870]|nr:transglycosylase SLT domain protein [Brucella abortus]AIJ65396.1 transglycosylase SLT domain protein [Brucella abortus bv. 6 str. 870]
MLRFPFTPEKKLRIKIAATVALAIIGASLSAGTALADAGFRQWIANFRPVAIKSGIAPSTFDRAFRGVNEPDPVVLEKARYQPEFTEPVWNYIDNRVNEQSVAVGQNMARK